MSPGNLGKAISNKRAAGDDDHPCLSTLPRQLWGFKQDYNSLSHSACPQSHMPAGHSPTVAACVRVQSGPHSLYSYPASHQSLQQC